MRLSIFGWALASLPLLGFGQVEVSVAPDDEDGTVELHWEAEAGARYEPRYSTDLVAWTTVEGFPVVAAKSGQADPISFELADDRLFFKVLRWEVGDEIPPADASDFAATGGDRSVVLTWEDAADDDIAWYEITWSPGGAAATIVAADAETFTATNLSAGTNFTFTIKTVDTSGNRSDGVTATAATAALLPVTITVTPTQVAMSQFESLVLTATVDPKPEAPLRFEWRTMAMYGTLDGDQSSPSVYVDDDVTDGTSEVTYTAILPGRPENISVAVYLASEPEMSSNELVEGLARLEVSGPKQTSVSAYYEYTTEGPDEGRMSTEYLTAEIIKAIPGVINYVFKLEREPGEGWYSGPLGVKFIEKKGGSLKDSDFLIEEFGIDVFGLGETHLAVFGRGGGILNYKPDDPNLNEKLEAQRAHYNNLLLAEWSVTPNTFWDRWDE